MSLRDYLFYEEPGITLYCGDDSVVQWTYDNHGLQADTRTHCQAQAVRCGAPFLDRGQGYSQGGKDTGAAFISRHRSVPALRVPQVRATSSQRQHGRQSGSQCCAALPSVPYAG